MKLSTLKTKRPLPLLTILLSSVAGLFHALDASTTADKDTAFWNAVYSENKVLEIDISVTESSWNKMTPQNQQSGRSSFTRGRGPGGSGKSEFEYVGATIRIDGQLFENAGLRFKGNSSYRSARGGLKRPLKIDMNRFVKGQKLHGRTKFNLSNSYLDPSYMKEKLAYEVYRAAGIPTPGVGWAKVNLTIEGKVEKQPLGIYVLIEQVNQDFMNRNFGDGAKDSLLMKPENSSNWEYAGETPESYQAYNIKIGEENVERIKHFAALTRIIHSGSDHMFMEEMRRRIDLKNFAAYLATNSLLSNIDSYIGMPHNYYLFLSSTDHKLRILPWDVNEAFGTFTMGSTPAALTDWAIDRPWVADLTLLNRLFKDSSFRTAYQTALASLMRDTFTERKLFSRLQTFKDAITPHLGAREKRNLEMGLEGNTYGYNAAVERQVFAIKPFIRKRIASVTAQLAGTSTGTALSGRRGGPGGRPPGRGGPGGRSRRPGPPRR